MHGRTIAGRRAHNKPAAPPAPPAPPVLSLQRGIRALCTCFSPDERHVAFGVLAVGAKWLSCHELGGGARTFEAATTTQILVARVKNGRTTATAATPARAFASVLVTDTATGAEREVLSIARLRPPKTTELLPPLEVHASPCGRFLAVAAQEEQKRMLRGYIAVAPR